MNHLEYEKLHISTSFIKGQDYLDIRAGVTLTDERTGFSKEGEGHIRAILISSNWTGQSFTQLTAGMDESLFNCASCLEAHNLTTGTAAFIVESEFGASERAHEDRAFVDLDSFLQEVLNSDIIVTFLPFSPERKRQLGFMRVWGPDRKSYSIKYIAGSGEMVASVAVQTGTGVDDEDSASWPVGPILNRLRCISLAESAPSLSVGAKKIVELFKGNGNVPLTKQMILNAVELNEDDLSMALMELLELDLLDESVLKEEEVEPVQEVIKPIYGDLNLLQAVKDRKHTIVKELLQQPGVQINDIDAEGRNALFIALDNSDLDMTRLLLEAGIDPNYENEDGMTAIKLCWLTRNRAAESLLREYGAELDM
ncbi:ankyrin repeat domain-containing protein [Paenibacillus taichungensis]